MSNGDIIYGSLGGFTQIACIIMLFTVKKKKKMVARVRDNVTL